jgi:hypothetical protein
MVISSTKSNRQFNNKYSVIITCENKEEFLVNTINSCLESANGYNVKIFVVYTFLKNEVFLKSNFNKFNNIIFLKIPFKKNKPTQDQLFKIESTLKYINNEWVLLLDGDDIFLKNKISVLNKLNLQKNFAYLHNHIIQTKNNFEYIELKTYKKLYFYKKLFNDWPQKINTSSIVISGHLIKKFFKNHKPYKWKYLAVDSQIILFFFYKNKMKYLNQILTRKLEDINNLDQTFSNLKTKMYWKRRMEQHKLTYELSGKINFMDKFLTLVMTKIFK